MGFPAPHLSLLPVLLKGSVPNLTHLYLTKLHLGRRITFQDHCELPALRYLHISSARGDRLFQLSRRCPILLSFVCREYFLPFDDPEDEDELHVDDAPTIIPGMVDQILVSSLRNFGQLERITRSQNVMQTAFTWTRKPLSIIALPGIKTVTLIGNGCLPPFYDARADQDHFNLPTFDHFMQTFTHLNHLILYNVAALWPNAQQHHFTASLQSIERIAFEGIIRLSPIRAALKLLPNLRSLKFEACQPSFTHGNLLQLCNLATSSVFEPEYLSKETHPQLPKYPKRLIVKLVNLLTAEPPSDQDLPWACCSTLQRLELSGLTIDESDIRSLLKLLKLYKEHQERIGTATPYPGMLTLNACFYTGVVDNVGGENTNDIGHAYTRVPVHDAESMGYCEAKELFKDLPEEFEDAVEAEEEEISVYGRANSEDEIDFLS
jgi:hypothetical protein